MGRYPSIVDCVGFCPSSPGTTVSHADWFAAHSSSSHRVGPDRDRDRDRWSPRVWSVRSARGLPRRLVTGRDPFSGLPERLVWSENRPARVEWRAILFWCALVSLPCWSDWSARRPAERSPSVLLCKFFFYSAGVSLIVLFTTLSAIISCFFCRLSIEKTAIIKDRLSFSGRTNPRWLCSSCWLSCLALFSSVACSVCPADHHVLSLSCPCPILSCRTGRSVPLWRCCDVSWRVRISPEGDRTGQAGSVVSSRSGYLWSPPVTSADRADQKPIL